jgi:transcriptional regulator with XRE-family HTH domain
MLNDADRAGTPAGVFGAELRFYRTRAALSQKDLAALVHVSNDVISKIETGERPPAEDFPPRLDAVPELDTRGALTRQTILDRTGAPQLWCILDESVLHRPIGGAKVMPGRSSPTS